MFSVTSKYGISTVSSLKKLFTGAQISATLLFNKKFITPSSLTFITGIFIVCTDLSRVLIILEILGVNNPCSPLLWLGSIKAERLVSGFIFRGISELIMATLGGSRGDRLANSNPQRSAVASPEKVRELLNDGVSSTAMGSNRCVF